MKIETVKSAKVEEVENYNKNEISEEDIKDFLDFLSENETYLDTGCGAFHTDNHSNW